MSSSNGPGAAAGSLPPELTSLVGRHEDIARVRESIGRSRLITLTGPGGVGKTRLALHAGHSLLSAYPDGVWFVELGAVPDGGLVEAAIAAALRIEDSGSHASGKSLGDRISDWQALLILDNCEHLVDACAAVVGRLLTVAPQLQILATSREPLRVTGEQTLVVQPLQTPSADADVSPEQVSGCAAVQLLVERARAVEPGFVVDADNVDAVRVLVQQLDGLPLAIELAAARLRSLSAGDIVRRLDGRYRLFTSPVRDTPARHHDLEALVGWSYALCGATERTLWERMSVFAGPADLDAIEAVCRGHDLNVYAVAELVDSLVAKSILAPTGADRHTYRMLGLVREYGRKRLDERGETDRVLARHAAYYRDVVAAVAAEWFGPDQAALAQKLLTTLPNLRAAMQYFLDAGRDVESATFMATELWRLWMAQGLVHEGARWVRQVVDATPSPAMRYKATWVLGWIELIEGNVEYGVELLRQGADEATAAGDDEAADYATLLLGPGYAFLDRMEEAAVCVNAALDRRRRADDVPGIAIALYLKAQIDWGRGDYDLTLAGGLECEEICAQHRERWAASYGLWVQSLARFSRGEYEAAIELGQRSIRAKWLLHDIAGVLLAAEAVRWAAAAAGHTRQAAELDAAIQPLWATTCSPLLGFKYLLVQRDRCTERLQAELGAEQYQQIIENPKRATLERVVDLALFDSAADLDAAGPAVPETQPLTERERQVAQLISEGLANKEIATRLHVARRTVEVHVANIMRKLEVNSRVQIATWYAGVTKLFG